MSFPIFPMPPTKMSKKCPADQKKIQKNVKKMSQRIKKHFKNIFWTFLGSKMGSRPNRPQPQEPPAPFSMTKNVQKMFLKCFFILRDIFLTFFWNYFWSAGHFFDIFLAGLKILEMTFFRHFLGIFELVLPNSLGQPNISNDNDNENNIEYVKS